MQFKPTPTTLAVAAGITIIAIVASVYIFGSHKVENKPGVESASAVAAPDPDKVTFNEKQVKSIEINTAATHAFSLQRTAVGNIDFNENLAVQVFPPYQGKIIKAFADVGDQVTKGTALYTIDSPDLMQAESALIAADGVYNVTTSALKRGKELFANQGLAQKDMEQAFSDQQTADAALKAAREVVRLYGKSESEINTIIASHKIDPVLVVLSPIAGRVTARVAQPGLLVQPGNAPAPYAVADLSTMWMIANVTESDSPVFKVGQTVNVKVSAFPDRDFSGKIAVIGATVDPATRTVAVRSEISDPKHELKPGMFATYVIKTGEPQVSVAIPLDGVARESDGSMSVWVTKDKQHFVKRTVKLGLQQDGLDQLLSGLEAGELVVTKGAIFLSNMANGSPE